MKRWEWLKELVLTNQWTKGAELGVKEGMTLYYLLENCPELHMIGVDVWQSIPGYIEWNHKHHEYWARERAKDFKGRVKLLKMTTNEASMEIKNHSLDFVFIDADHRTNAVVEDIINWLPKLNKTGVLCGHDAGKSSVKKALDLTLNNWQYFPQHDKCWLMGDKCLIQTTS